jgi:ParB-like chromosome segregation protein Spo0J
VAQIAGSIKEFGFTNPVLIDEQSGIIAGHGRVLAARKLGMETLPCIRLAHLTDAQRRAYVIADNNLAINAGWDEETLKSEIERLMGDGFDAALLGFDENELGNLLKSEDTNFEPGTEGDQGELDKKSPIECPHCNKFFTP